MAASGNADWLYSVGVDTTQAVSDLNSFVQSSTAKLAANPVKVEVSFDFSKTKSELTSYIQSANNELAKLKPIDININMKGATRSLNTFLANFTKQSAVLDTFQEKLAGVNASVEAHSAALAGQTKFFEAVTMAAQKKNVEINAQVRANKADAVAAGENQAANQRLRGEIVATTGAVKGHGDALDFLRRIATNTIFKFIEYEVVMQAFTGTVHELTSSLTAAGNTDFEMTLQRLYNSTINVNQTLENAMTIAKQWGSDVNDVQQVIGLWTKQTNDLTAATYLANEAEKMHAASGIDTLEVYRSSIALSSQLGLSLKSLPGYYDMIASAALKIAVPLKAVGTSTEEGIRDIFEGVDKDAALLSSLGFRLPQIIAANALQVQGLGEKGKEAGQQLATMFAALATQGSGTGANLKGAAKYQEIIGKDVFASGDPNKILKAMVDNVGALEQAYMQSDLKVRAQSGETFKAVLNYAKQIKELSDQIQKDSNGKLDLISEQAIQSFNGRLAQMKAGVQAFTITLGQQLLPSAIKFTDWATTVALPALQTLVPEIVNVAHVLALMGVGFMAYVSWARILTFFSEFSAQTNIAVEAGFRNVQQMEAAQAAADQEAVAIERLNAAKALYNKTLEESVIAEGASAKAMVTTTAAATEEGLGMQALTGEMLAASEAAAGPLVAGLGRAAGVMGGLGAAALRTIGPFVALAVAIGLVTSALDGLDKQKALNAEIDSQEAFDSEGNPLVNLVRKQGIFGAVHTIQADDVGLLSGNAKSTDISNWIGAKERKNDKVGNRLMVIEGQISALRDEKNNPSNWTQAGDSVAYTGKDYDAQINALNTERYDIVRKHFENQAQTAAAAKFKQGSAAYQKLVKQIMADSMASLDKSMGQAESKTPLYQDKGGGKSKGALSPSQAAAYDMQNIKRDRQADMNSLLQQASAAKEDASAEKTLAESYQYTQAGLTRMVDAHNQETTFTLKAVAAAKEEVSQIGAREVATQKYVATHKLSAAEAAKFTKILSEMEDAHKKAAAAADFQTAKLRALQAQNGKDENEYRASLALQKAGLTDFQGQVEAIKATYQNRGSGVIGTILGAADATADLESLKTRLQTVIAQLGATGQSNDPRFKELARDLNLVNSALGTTKQSATAAIEKLQELTATIASQAETLTKDNIGSLQEILGIDPAQSQALIAAIDDRRKINDEIEKARKLQEEIGNLDDAHAALAKVDLQNMRDQIAEQQKLLPILRAIQQTRNSESYKATESVIQKFGQQGFDNLISNAFGKTKNVFKQMLADWTTQVVNTWWTNTAKSLTDAIFGNKEQQQQILQLQQMYKDHVTGLTTIAQTDTDTETAFNTSVQHHGTYIDNFTKAVGTFGEQVSKFSNAASRNGGGSSGGGTASGLGNSWDLFKMVLPNVPFMMPDVPKNIKAIADNTQVQADVISSALHMPAGSTSSGGLSALISGGLPGFGNFAQQIGSPFAKLGPLGGLLEGATIGGAVGSMFNGDGGGTHGTWGAVGGTAAVAGLAAMAGWGGGMGAGLSALMASGPAGWGLLLGAALLGGLGGGMFGHSINSHDNPDITNTQQWGQFAADFQSLQQVMNDPSGTHHVIANGQQFSQSQSISQETDNKGIGQYLHDQLQSMSSTQKEQVFGSNWQQIDAMFSQWDARGLHDGKDGNIMIGNSTFRWDNVDSLGTEAMNALNKNGQTGQSLAPIFSINALGAGPNYSPGPYNVPGLSSSDFQAMQSSGFKGWGVSSYYTTPGVGTGNIGPPPTGQPPGSGPNPNPNPPPITITTNVNVDGQLLASIVNSYNSAAASRNVTYV